MKRWSALCITLLAAPVYADDKPSLLGSPSWESESSLLNSFAAGPLDSPNAGDDTFVKIRIGGIFAFADGTLQVGNMVGGATNILDIEDTLNQDTDDVSPTGSVTIALPVIDISIELGLVGDFTFEGTTTNTISFDDQSFSGTVESSEEITIYELNVLYELAEVKFVTIYLGGGVRAVDATATITGTVSGSTVTESESAFIPVPVAVAGAHFDLGKHVALRGQLAGLYLGDYGTVIDAKAEIGYDFHRMFGVFVGYRFMNVESDASDVEIDATLQGLYAGAEVRF